MNVRYKQISSSGMKGFSCWKIIGNDIGDHGIGEDFEREFYKFRFNIVGNSNSLIK